jgi:hypothetical protein
MKRMTTDNNNKAKRSFFGVCRHKPTGYVNSGFYYVPDCSSETTEVSHELDLLNFIVMLPKLFKN